MREKSVWYFRSGPDPFFSGKFGTGSSQSHTGSEAYRPQNSSKPSWRFSGRGRNNFILCDLSDRDGKIYANFVQMFRNTVLERYSMLTWVVAMNNSFEAFWVIMRESLKLTFTIELQFFILLSSLTQRCACMSLII